MRKQATRTKSRIQPFEWLTSPESIGGFVKEHVLGEPIDNGVGKNKNSRCDNDDAQETSAPTAMHIGCGSSTVGEYLVREIGFGWVVNVDRDRETLEGMAERWFELTHNNTDSNVEMDAVDETKEGPMLLSPSKNSTMKPRLRDEHRSNNNNNNNNNNYNKMEFWCLDYTSQKLPDHYEASFDLVVDKSTLDCTLCSDCSATASFLAEIYRTLKPNGGVYLVISFHELELLLPLLQNLPGADWTVTHTTMDRQVECLVTNASGSKPSKASSPTPQIDDPATPMRKPLNVLVARRGQPRGEAGTAVPFSPPLVLHEVVEHVQEVNDRWFRDEQPLLTKERIEDLKASFCASSENSMNQGELCLSLRDAYGVIFTDAEREHLTYGHFLEDWEAFCDDEAKQEENVMATTTSVTYDQAIEFLRANQ